MSAVVLSRPQQVLGLLAWLALSFATSAIGAFASRDAGSFYRALERPAWAPPGWLFGPVWSVLFLCMAVAAWLVWRSPSEGSAGSARRQALALFGVQLVANALWSWLFFGWRLGGLAFAEVLLLWVLIAATLLAFWRVSRPAAALLVPYLAWVSFAAALNWALWRANPALLG